jgi:tryptophan synthase alpha chain
MGKLGIYLVADYPSRETFLGAVRACEACKVDFLEVGFAFSDPVADGEVLERAAHTVLKERNVDDFVAALDEARSMFTGRLYVMTYANIVYSNGMGAFAKRLAPLSGLIVADLPLREIGAFERNLNGSELSLIRFLTPESRAEDVASALRGAKDFIYFVSKRGTTGGAFELDDETRNKIVEVRGKGVEVFVGFGVQEKRDLETAYSVADGAIIGTRAVKELEQGVDRFEAYLRSLRA